MKQKILHYVIASCVLFMACTVAKPPSIVEFRFVYIEPGPNRTKYINEKSKDEVYADSHILLSLDDIESATVGKNTPFPNWYREQFKTRGVDLPPETHRYRITIRFTENSSKKLYSVTRKNIGKSLGIFINQKLIISPKIMEPISGGLISVTGQYTQEEAQEIADNINRAVKLKK